MSKTETETYASARKPRRADAERNISSIIVAAVATLASLVSIAVLPRAEHFLLKLRLSPQAMPSH